MHCARAAPARSEEHGTTIPSMPCAHGVERNYTSQHAASHRPLVPVFRWCSVRGQGPLDGAVRLCWLPEEQRGCNRQAACFSAVDTGFRALEQGAGRAIPAATQGPWTILKSIAHVLKYGSINCIGRGSKREFSYNMAVRRCLRGSYRLRSFCIKDS